SDVYELLERLQQIWLGTFKIKVNVSKFYKEEEKQHPAHAQECLSRPEGFINNSYRSFVEVLDNNRVNLHEVSSHHVLPFPPPRFVLVDVSRERLDALKGSLVGFLRNDCEFLALSDSLRLEEFKNIAVCNLGVGGGMVLFKSNVAGALKFFLDSCVRWWSAWCSKMVPWTPDVVTYRRAVWVSVWGVPIHVWGLDLFVKIANYVGDYINVNEATLKEVRLDRGWIHIWLPATAKMVDEVVEVRTEGVSYHIRVIEETDGDRNVPVCVANDCSSVGDGSNSIAAGFRHSPTDWESTGDGEEEGEEVTGIDRGHEEYGT
ncbi:hypothetical protein A2U01_0021524, partial [Trifolium medium]|nr:hypothetical protein [Trifolium medium]